MLEYLLFFSKEERGCYFIKDMIIRIKKKKFFFRRSIYIIKDTNIYPICQIFIYLTHYRD